MRIDKFKQQNADILGSIAKLRNYVKDGVCDHATQISSTMVSMTSAMKVHLAVEHNLLFPALQQSNDPALVRMGKQFEDEMNSVAAGYLAFARIWNSDRLLRQDPERFRSEADRVLETLQQRVQSEKTALYPLIEAH